MNLFRIVSLSLLLFNFQNCFSSNENPYKTIINAHGSFYCLDQAARNKNVVIFERFLEAGADKHASHGGVSIMSTVIRRGWSEGIHALIAHGCVFGLSDLTAGRVRSRPHETLKPSRMNSVYRAV